MNRIVVVTGGTKGLGKEMVEFFKNNGDIVLSLARSANAENEYEYVCDVSDENQVKLVIKDIAKRFGRIDLLINNAGFGLSGITELISSEQAKQIFDVNFFNSSSLHFIGESVYYTLAARHGNPSHANFENCFYNIQKG